MDTFYTKTIACLLVSFQIAFVLSTPVINTNIDSISSDTNDELVPIHRELVKRGGARAFYGFYNTANSKRDNSAGSPYYLYEKRGGGRAFSHNANLYFRPEKRGGGRAFGGSWSPYLERFYDIKRSSYPLYFTDNY